MNNETRTEIKNACAFLKRIFKRPTTQSAVNTPSPTWRDFPRPSLVLPPLPRTRFAGKGKIHIFTQEKWMNPVPLLEVESLLSDGLLANGDYFFIHGMESPRPIEEWPAFAPMAARAVRPLRKRVFLVAASALALVAFLWSVALHRDFSLPKSGFNNSTASKDTLAARKPPVEWISVSYANLLESGAIVRTGESLASAVRDSGLRNAVQPFVDSYSQLLPAALEITNGPDKMPHHSVVDFFPVGSRQPAWVAILRGGRIHICTDDKDHVKVFLLGDDPRQAYGENYSVIRHCLAMLQRHATGGALQVDVFAYHNEYPTSELKLNPEPYPFREASFDSKKADF